MRKAQWLTSGVVALFYATNVSEIGENFPIYLGDNSYFRQVEL